MTTRVVVVGAGITGLTAAYTLATERDDVEVTLLEASDRVGGRILTTPFDGVDVDCGADAFLARVPDARELAIELGFADELVSPSEASALVWVDGALHRLPTGLVLGVPTDVDALIACGFISDDGIARLQADIARTEWIDGAPTTDDVSVGTLVRSRLGDEVYSKLVAPLLSGVNAGDADQLSVATGAAQLAAAARRHPSLVRGLLEQAADARAAVPNAGPVFHGILGGTQRLTDRLAERAAANGARLLTSTRVDSLTRSDGAWRIGTDGDAHLADHVLLTTPAPITAALLRSLAPSTARDLDALEYASVAMVTLSVPTDAVACPLDASGFLVAPTDRLPTVTAVSWASTKWAHLSRPGRALLRVSAGRHGDDHALALDDDQLVARIGDDLAVVMGLSAPPTAARVTRWVQALPQYRPGHLDRVAAWREELARVAPGVAVAGAVAEGLGLPACIRQGRAAARSVA